MTTKQLFLLATEVCPMEQNEFFLHLGNALRALLARYPTSLLAKEGDCEIKAPSVFSEDCGVNDLYGGALLRGVIAGKSGSEADRLLFLEEADAAYLNLWRRAARGKRHVGR